MTHESCDQEDRNARAHHRRSWLEVLRVVVRGTDLILLRIGKLPLDTLMGKFIVKEIS